MEFVFVVVADFRATGAIAFGVAGEPLRAWVLASSDPANGHAKAGSTYKCKTGKGRIHAATSFAC